MDVLCENFRPSFDSITNDQEEIVNYILLGLQTLLGIFIFYTLVQLCKKSFSYRKDGIYETIEFNIICLATLILIILTRLCEVWFYKTGEHQANCKSSQNFTILLAELTILFVNDIYLYGSIVWFRMIYESEQSAKYKKIQKIIRIGGIYIINPLVLTVITYIHLFHQDNYVQPTLIIIFVMAVLVEAIFMFASIKLIKYWDHFQIPQKYVQYFKYILYVLLVVSVIRIAMFTVKIASNDIDLNFRKFDSVKGEDIGPTWAVLMFFYSMFVSMMPILIFLFLFKYKINIRDQGLNMSNLLLKSYVG